jgi:protein-S-isoprenylcysteine O-methyltransferase Ste14
MDTGLNIITLCWMVQGVYWIIGAANVRAEHKEIGNKGDFWHYLMLFLAFALLNLSFYFSSGYLIGKVVPQSNLMLSLAVLVVILGFGLVVWARFSLASNWTASVDFFKGNKLVKAGPYKLVRHPIYLGFILMFLGTFSYNNTVAGMIGFCLLVGTLVIMIRQEEKNLTKSFPDKYPEYQRQTSALIPFVL